MNYDKKSPDAEYKGYSSRHSYNSVREANNNIIGNKHFRDAEEQRKIERAKRLVAENNQTKQLLELGKLCGYVEIFDEIPLDKQNIMPVEKIENPRDTESFIEGYNRGKMLAQSGLPKQAYHDFAKHYEDTYSLSHGKQKN